MFSASKTAGPSGYNISRSVRLRSSASAYLNRTPAAAGSSTKMTISLWAKRGILSSNTFDMMTSGASGSNDALRFTSGDILQFWFAGATYYVQTTAVFRDPSAWYHIVASVDTTQATAANRMVLYVNGVQQTAVSAAYPPQNYAVTNLNKNVAQYIGYNTTGYYLDGYITEFNFIDGQALTPSSFGSTNATTGVWQPAKYTGTYGTNGFYLNFSDNSAATAAAIGKDYSGNGNNFTPNNISVTAGVTYDSMVDVPTPYADGSTNRGNYAVLSPIVPTGSAVISGGNLNIVSAGTYCNGLSTIGLDSGAYYAECVVTTHSAEGWGVWDVTKTAAANTGGIPSGFYGIYSGGATLCSNGSNLGTNAAGTPANGDIIQVAWNNGKVWVGKNNTWYDSSFGTTGNPGAGTNATFTGLTAGQFAVIFGAGNATVSLSANFGQRPFSYTPPSGFKAINTYNLPASTITNGGKYMAATLYTGNGSTQSVTNAGSFKPDFVWIKSRSGNGNHSETDSVRGVNKQLFPNLTDAEGSQTDQVTAFNSNGFSLGANAAGTGSVNVNTVTYVAWQWQAGQGSTSSNTSGSITSTVSVNATAGFSVVTYTGTQVAATIGHGLGIAPKMIIVKPRSSTGDWQVYTSTTGAGNYLLLDTTAASAASTTKWNNTSPTSSVFSVGIDTTTNLLAATYVAYCWSEIAGFSKFGSYTGNGSADGVFVYLGFRPRWVMFKRTDAIEGWYMYDTSRDTYNVMQSELRADSSAAEANFASRDFLSNGFKIRTANGSVNASGGTYIYAAFAENPFQNSLAR